MDSRHGADIPHTDYTHADTDSYMQIHNTRVHKYIQSDTHTHTVLLRSPCVFFAVFHATLWESEIQTAALSLSRGCVSVCECVCVCVQRWGGTHYYVWHHLCFHWVWISNQTHPLFLPAFPHRFLFPLFHFLRYDPFQLLCPTPSPSPIL